MRRVAQTLFGIGVGVAVRLLLPGHHSVSLLAAIGLSLAGAVCGEFAAERFLPDETVPQGGFVTSAIGALAVLLVYGIAS